MIHLGLLDRFRNNTVTISTYRMITEERSSFYSWDGDLYRSDIIRAAIRPQVRAIGKIIGKHIRENEKDLKVNPEPYMRFLLEEPNPYMTGQMLQEKLATHLELNNNAFAYIERNEDGIPVAIYPITSTSVEALQGTQGKLYLKFMLKNGKSVTFRYSDIIHLRKDFNKNEIFGDSPAPALTSLMEIVNTTDQGIVKAIKSSNIIRWLLKFNQTLRPEDLKKQTKQFIDDYMNIESDAIGAAATDAKADAIQVEPKDYVPNHKQMEETTQRIYSFFNTNKDIVQASYDEDQWISFYESAIEPTVKQLSEEYTRKLFSRKERGHGNKIMFESSDLTFASMKTKLAFKEMVDRGSMTPNEWRKIIHLAPLEDGDKPIRRLDTRPTEEDTQGGVSR